MMKTYYRLTMNGILRGDYEDVHGALQRATNLEGDELTWKSLDDDAQAYSAFGRVINGLRTDWEIQPVKKRV